MIPNIPNWYPTTQSFILKMVSNATFRIFFLLPCIILLEYYRATDQNEHVQQASRKLTNQFRSRRKFGSYFMQEKKLSDDKDDLKQKEKINKTQWASIVLGTRSKSHEF